MYNDRYTFHLAGFRFDMQTNGDVYLNSAQAGNFPGAFSAPASDLMAPYADQLNKGWSINDDGAVLFDFNHPLAGHPVTFEVHVIGIL